MRLKAGPPLADEVVEIYHLAAIYDLGVRREFAMRVNVEGTRNMLEFACHCRGLRRFQYVSTCYVSGTHAGEFSETDLERGQRFHNFYEETKYLAEVDVQKRMREGLPVTIYRPAIVVGDSKTGNTQKYDGPYSVIRFLLRQPRLAVLPKMGDPDRTEVNLVRRLSKLHPDKDVVPLSRIQCLCSTMFRIDPWHLCWVLENLAEGHVVNQVTVGAETRHWASQALERMLSLS